MIVEDRTTAVTSRGRKVLHRPARVHILENKASFSEFQLPPLGRLDDTFFYTEDGGQMLEDHLVCRMVCSISIRESASSQSRTEK